ncbi:hypothetical protein EGT42_00420 [Acinetobacter haemolyticus]|nr:hypothetical protein EGT42_00420 [Acinetobacter haemolyticus]
MLFKKLLMLLFLPVPDGSYLGLNVVYNDSFSCNSLKNITDRFVFETTLFSDYKKRPLIWGLFSRISLFICFKQCCYK